ncbi:hypothetical protein Tco_0412004 [Tanacetum coccineum]
MTNKYCLRGEIKKLEVELWNLKVKGTDVIWYNQHFQELALLCVRMFPEESNKIERYVGGLPDMINGSVVALKPKTMQEAIEMATELMDKKICTFAKRQTRNKWKQDDNNNQAQQQPPKKQGVAIAYNVGSGKRKEYAGTLPDLKEMTPKKRTTGASPAITTTTTSVTNAQLKALIDKGTADALAAC